jgi:Tol biopolymer transport system component
MFVLLLGTCGGDTKPEATIPLATVMSTDVSSTTAEEAAPIVATPCTDIPSPTSDVSVPAVTLAPTHISSPTPTATHVPAFATPAMTATGGILIAYGVNDKLTLAQIDFQGNVLPLSEPRRMSGFYWQSPYLSPNGTWVAYFRPGARNELVIYNLQTREEQTIPQTGVYADGPIFDETSRRIAYTTRTGLQSDGTDEWAIHVHDITTDAETILKGPVVGQSQQYEPLPGAPIAWVDDELFLDTYVPYAEMVNQGIWVLNLSSVAPGETTSLQDYDRLMLSSTDVFYMDPTISPNGDMMAFVVYDDDHQLTCYDNPLEDGAVTGLGVLPITGGEPRILVDISGDDSALTDQPLAWSPDGDQILFAQSTCPDVPSSFEPTLRTVNLQGIITHEWPLVRIEYTVNQEALWCASEQIFYLRGQGQLWRLSVETGQTEQVLSSEQIRLIGCFP